LELLAWWRAVARLTVALLRVCCYLVSLELVCLNSSRLRILTRRLAIALLRSCALWISK
jgi:hypothetical protein